MLNHIDIGTITVKTEQLQSSLVTFMGQHFRYRTVRNRIQLYFWIISAGKKLIFPIVVVFMQKKVVFQLIVLAIISLFPSLSKLGQRIIAEKSLLISICGDIVYVAVVFLKI
jgi:hypothetical protein